MTDLHTHILPGIDDGSPDVETSLAMLRMEWDQGVDRVALTPHLYREREGTERFLRRRQRAYDELRAHLDALPVEEQRKLPQLILGAEVAWVPNLAQWERLTQLCLGNSEYFLLELPFTPWNDGLLSQLYEVMGNTGLTPVIAHLERYLGCQRREHINEILSMGLPVQVSAAPLGHWLRGRGPLKLLRDGLADFVASDCHDLTRRPPDLGPGMELLRRKLGERRAEELAAFCDELIP